MEEIDELIVEIPFDNVEEATFRALSELIKKGEIDSVLTLNNNLASSCLKYFKKNKITIPEELFFASYDNVEWFDYASPIITGVAQPIQAIGEKSVEILINRIDKKVDNFENISLESKLIIRESSSK